MDSKRWPRTRQSMRECALAATDGALLRIDQQHLLALLDAADERDRLRKFADGTLTICPGCCADLANGEPLSEKHLVCDRCGAIVEGFKPVTWQAAAFAMRDERDRLRERIDRLVALCESEEEMDAIEGRE